MPTALIINPNTTESMTRDIAASASKVFTPPWQHLADQPPGGPESIESWLEMNLATTAILSVFKEHEGVDGIVLACFGDSYAEAEREALLASLAAPLARRGLEASALVAADLDEPLYDALLDRYLEHFKSA